MRLEQMLEFRLQPADPPTQYVSRRLEPLFGPHHVPLTAQCLFHLQAGVRLVRER